MFRCTGLNKATATASCTVFLLRLVLCCSDARVQFHGFIGRNHLNRCVAVLAVSFAASDAPCLVADNRLVSIFHLWEEI
jgi:hypothetical protein